MYSTPGNTCDCAQCNLKSAAQYGPKHDAQHNLKYAVQHDSQSAGQHDLKHDVLLLHNILKAYHIDVGCDALQLCVQHLQKVLNTQDKVNTTAITDYQEALTLHIADSLLLLPEVNKTQGTIIDIGTGAGFPGLPLAIATGRQTVLLDARSKKIAAVDPVIRELGLQSSVTTSCERVETYAQDHQGLFGCVVARAVGPLEVLLEYASPLLQQEGSLVAAKGREDAQEFANASKAARQVGMQLDSSRTCTLPSGQVRTVYKYMKVSTPKVPLPRKPGRAVKRPLGTYA